MSRLPHTIKSEDLESLLSEATSSVPVTRTEFKTDVIPFLANFNIVPGTHPVKNTALYKLYKAYSEEPVDRLAFDREVALFINSYGNKNGRFFQINHDQFIISDYIQQKLTENKRRVETSPGTRKHFETFLEESKIEQGDTWFEGFLIHHIYRNYCDANKKARQLNYDNFIKMLMLYFEGRRVTVNRSLWFKVSKNTVDILTPEDKDIVRASRENPNKATNRNKGNPKKSKKRFSVSSTRPLAKSSDKTGGNK